MVNLNRSFPQKVIAANIGVITKFRHLPSTPKKCFAAGKARKPIHAKNIIKQPIDIKNATILAKASIFILSRK